VTAEPLSFFAIDHGTANVAASLVAPLGDRFRLLASGTVPTGVDPQVLLEDLVARVVATDAEVLSKPDGWADWARLESRTFEPIAAVCVAPSARSLAPLVRAVAGAGWEIRASASTPEDPLAIADACLDPEIGAVVLGGMATTPAEHGGLLDLAALVAHIAQRRDDLWILLASDADDLSMDLPSLRTIKAPEPEDAPPWADTGLRRSALDVAVRLRTGGPDGSPQPVDSREGIRRTVQTLARLLERRIEAVDVGHAAGSRTIAQADGTLRHLVSAGGALVPALAMRDDHEVEGILRWSALRLDPFTLVDRVRNLRLAPGRGEPADAGRLQLAALRAALARLQANWHSDGHSGQEATADLFIACGGAFEGLPAAAAALAVVDALRRPGAMGIYRDHARLLGPIGSLPEEADRRRLLADLLDDALLPVGSTVVTGEVRAVRHPGRMRVVSALRQNELELAPGALRLLDLPPGVTAQVEFESHDGTLMGLPSRHLALQVSGGLGGLLVDTREVPLKLPDRAERRRALFESWERPVWANVRG
jgi:hypothetical protein